MAEGGHDGAWYCSHREQFDAKGLRNFCPDEGCPKSYCARDAGWNFGEPSPDRCTGIIRSTPMTNNDDRRAAELLMLRGAVMEVLDAVRDYLPPNGIDAQECLNRVIGAVDNPNIRGINAAIAALRAGDGR